MNIIKKNSFSVLVFLGTAFLVADPGLVFAQAATLGDILQNGCTNTGPIGHIFSYIAWTAGIVMALRGIHHLRAHSENTQNHPLHRGILFITGGSLLLSLPAVTGTIIKSVFVNTQSSNGLGCSAAGGSGAGGAGLDQMVAGFVTNIQGPLVSFVSAIAIVSGIFMMVRGLMKAGHYGVDPKTHSIHSILTHLGFGALLMAIGDNLNMMMGSVFGSGATVNISASSAASSVLSWGFVSSLGGGSQQFATAVGAALTFIQLIGIIAFVRGWMVMKKVVEGGGNVTLAQGITHIVGGVLAINIAGFLKIMDTTFGTNLL